tara:strand:+ start:769 stop:1254 length:486 start_codon:yes stop_codon:yes gene_type:complete
MKLINFNKVKLIVYDFDGVMTDNKAYVDQNGSEMVQVNRSDGLAINIIKSKGFDQIILSSETNQVVNARAEKLNIQCIYGVENKRKQLQIFCEQRRYDLDSVLFIGNDINDKEVMSVVGYPLCPNDAYKEIKEISCHVFMKNGGDGVIRELLELIQNKEVK